MNLKILQWIENNKELLVQTLFKPAQFKVITKLTKGKFLTENEKRYLRGAIKKKITILAEASRMNTTEDDLALFLNKIDSYYITGLSALKNNGYGWFFELKIIEVINTKIIGQLKIQNKLVKLFRVKSIKNSEILVNKEKGIKYASNEQIIKDTKITKNMYVKKLWIQMYARYGQLFAKKVYSKPKREKINYSKYGV